MHRVALGFPSLSLPLLGLMALGVSACGRTATNNRTSSVNSISVPSVDLPFLDEATFFETAEAGTGGSVEIWNASMVATIPTPLYRGVKVLSNGEKSLQASLLPILVTKSVTAASNNLTTTRDFYLTKFQRDSYDGEGAKIKAAVDIQQYHLIPVLGLKENAAWMQPFDHFVFGAGGSKLGGFAEALDVVAHEYTHAVISYTSNLEYVGQSGALNEHLADVFGELVQHAKDPSSEPFLIGETTLRGDFADQARALRDMLNPAAGLSKQPGHMDEIPDQFGLDCEPASNNDNCGVHILSGIPNRAAALIIQDIGWTKSSALFYTVMTERLGQQSDFAEYRNAVVAECARTLTTSDCIEVESAFEAVGL